MNKEQLEGMSDGELSLTILKIECDGITDIFSTSPPSSAFALLPESSGAKSSFDINSWADMGPIIKSSSISISSSISPMGESWRALNVCNRVIHHNPLRAAAIVYILTQGGE